MRVISPHPRFPAFWAEHPDGENALRAWLRFAEHAEWKNFADVRRDYPHASRVGRFAVFNIKGAKARLAMVVSYPRGKVSIHRIMIDKEYERGDWKSM